MIRNAVIIRQFALRHVEGAENQVEHRKRRGEILLAAAVCRGVVPAVKDRSGDDVFERTELPVEIGVDEGGMGDGQRSQHHEHVGRNTGHQQDDVGEYGAQEQVDRVKAGRGDPLELFG